MRERERERAFILDPWTDTRNRTMDVRGGK